MGHRCEAFYGAAAGLAVALLAGCGGGGAGIGVYKGAETPAAITVGDAQALTAAVMTAQGFDFPALTGFTKTGGAAPPAPGDLLSRFGFVHRQVRGLAKAGDGARAATKLTQACPDGGSVTLTVPSLTATTGTFKESFFQCDLGSGFVINGTVTETVATNTATVEAGNVGMNLSMAFGGASFRFTATVSYAYDGDALVNRTTGAFEYWDAAGAAGMRIAGMDVTRTYADLTDWDADCALTDDYAMTVYDAAFGGVQLATTTPVAYTGGACINPGPSSGGPIVLTGGGGGTITLTPLSTSQATVAIDIDGDTVPEQSTTELWFDLGVA